MTKRADRISAFFEATLYAGFDQHEAETLFGAPEIELRRVEIFLAPMLRNRRRRCSSKNSEPMRKGFR